MKELARGVQEVLVSLLLTLYGEISQLESIWGNIKLDSLEVWVRSPEHREAKCLLKDTLSSAVAKS